MCVNTSFRFTLCLFGNVRLIEPHTNDNEDDDDDDDDDVLVDW